MATYCISDVHGAYEKYAALLEKLRFSDEDSLYIIGDLVDRGTRRLSLIRDVMARENVIALAGNHERMLCARLQRLLRGGTDRSDMLSDFQMISAAERQTIFNWLRSLPLYLEITVSGEAYVLVHAGLGKHADPSRQLSDYTAEECLFARSDYTLVYPDRYIVSGHTPTQSIPGNPRPGYVFRTNRHIAIDCGCAYGGRLGAICLESGEEFYV